MNGLYIFFLGKPNCKYIILIGVLLSYSRLEMPKHIDSNCWKLPEKTMGPQCSYCSMNTLKSFEWNKKFHLLIDSMLPFQSPQTTPVPSTTKSSNPDTEQTISPTPPDHHKTAITTKTPLSTHSKSNLQPSSGLPELDSSWSVEKELRSTFKGQIQSIDVTLDDKLVVLTGIRQANNRYKCHSIIINFH